MASKLQDAWNDNSVQFPRLLTEIFMAGVTPEQLRDMEQSMDLSKGEILELFQRAEKEFLKIKRKL